MRRVLVLFLLMVGFVSGLPDQVVVNSDDWKDVCSGMLYAGIHRVDGHFILDQTQGTLVLDMLKGREVMVVQAPDNVVYPNYRAAVQQKGFTADLVSSDDINLLLAQDEENLAQGYIIMDERYPYNFISVAPYASLKQYYVLFADQENIDEILLIVGDSDVIVYGYVDREVTEALESLNPLIINEGDKYSNNIEILKLFSLETEPKQIVFTSGDFIEPQFFLYNNPVALIGISNVPEKTVEYLREAGVKYGMVVGNELVTSATNVKDRTGMKMIVKFAKGVNQVQYALDTVELPQPDFRPRLMEAVYNQFGKELIITIDNAGESPMMILPSYVVFNGNDSIQTFETEDVIFISGKGISTQSFQVDLDSLTLPIVEASILYGEDRNSLDKIIKETKVIETTTYEDTTDIEIVDAYYQKNIQRFVIEIKNTGTKAVFASAFIEDVSINNKIENLGTEEIIEIAPGETASQKIKAVLSDADIEDNVNLNIIVRYGLRKNLLTKIKKMGFDFVARSGINYLLYAALGVAAMGILFIIFGKKKKKPPRRRRIPPPP